MPKERSLRGVGASSGIAIGPAYAHITPDLSIRSRPPAAIEQEMERFSAAAQQAQKELFVLQARLVESGGRNEAGIFDAHRLMLEDPTLARKVRAAVEQGSIVEKAVLSATEETANLLAAMKDETFASRAMDVRDIGRRLLRILLGMPDTALANIQTPSIVVADELTPSDTASLNPRLVLGFCTASGGLTSHSAILAQALGIPAIVALGEDLMQLVSTGDPLLLDGREGSLFIHPTDNMVQRYTALKHNNDQYMAELKGEAIELTKTADGRRVEVAANIGDVESARGAVANGAEGVGLLRTEFIYLGDSHPPSEEQQFQIYRKIFDVMAGRPVIIRTLDIGGDKPPMFMPFPKEMNPFLGWRGIRVSVDQPDLFKTQLRAILRAAAGHRARIMLPMVSDLSELLRARQLFEDAKHELKNECQAHTDDVPLGIMVETPAAAVLVDVLSEAADFFSLGTNDLTQYTLAVDRGNATVAGLYQPLHPAVLRLIKQAIDLAHGEGKWIGMCGELASMPKAVPILLGLGLDEFSMSPSAIPKVKHLIRGLNTESAKRMADHALSLKTALDIEEYMKGVLSQQQ